VLDSLVRVSRRAGKDHFIKDAYDAVKGTDQTQMKPYTFESPHKHMQSRRKAM